MSDVIDNRVVKMDFDNKGFQKGIGESETALTGFEKMLKGLDGTNFGSGIISNLLGVQNAANNTNMDSLAESIGGIGEKFTALEAIAFGALERIGQKAADVGMKMVSSLTIDPIAEGFQKYTSATKDIKAIMNQTGDSVETVTDQMKDLSWYSDATSYSYNSMVSAAQRFVSQGIKMDEAIPMIMGIGNSLSYAGLAAEEASNGFDIYSKALAQGYISLKNWRELSTMRATTKGLKEDYMEAAVAAGTLFKTSEEGVYRTAKGLKVSVANFEQTLSSTDEKWLDDKVIKSVLSGYGKYAAALDELSKKEENWGVSTNELMDKLDAQIAKMPEAERAAYEFSKTSFLAAQEARTFSEAVNAVADAASSAWRSIFQSIFGNAEEATELWTEFSNMVYDLFMGPLLGLDTIMQKWNELGGRSDLIQGFRNLADSISSIVSPIKDAFSRVFDVFSQNTVNKLVELTAQFREWAAGIRFSDETMGKLNQVATKVAVTIQKLFDVFKSVVGVFKPFLSIAKSVADILYRIGDAIVSILPIEKFVGGLLDTVKTKLDNFAARIQVFADNLNEMKRAIGIDAAVSIKNFGKSLKEAIGNSEVIKGFGDLRDAIKSVTDTTKDSSNELSGEGPFSNLTNSLKDSFGPIKEQFSASGKGIFTALAEGMSAAAKTITTEAGSILGTILKTVGSAGADLFLAGKDMIIKIGQGMGSDKTTLPGVIFDVLEGIIDEMSSFTVRLTQIVIGTIGDIAQAITDGTPKIFGALKGFIHELAGFFDSQVMADIITIMDAIAEIAIEWFATTFPLRIEAAAGRISKAVATSLKSVGKGLGGVLDSIGENGVLGTIMGSKKGFSFANVGDQLKGIATAFLELAAALFIMSKIDPEAVKSTSIVLAESLGAVLAVLGSSALAKGKARPKDIKALGTVFKSIGLALIEFAAAAWILEGIDMNNALLSLGSMEAAVAIIALISTKIGEDHVKSLKTVEKAFSTISLSLIAFAGAAYIMDGMNINNALIGLGALFGATAIIAAISTAIDPKYIDGLVVLEKAFTRISTATAIFAVAAWILEGIDMQNALIALGSLVVAVGLLALIGKLLPEGEAAKMALAMGMVSVALILFAAALGALDLVVQEGTFLKAIEAIGLLIGSLTVLSLLSPLLMPAISVVGQLSLALLALGVAALAISGALALFITSLTALSTMGSAAIVAAVASLGLLLTSLVGLAEPLKNLAVMLIRVLLEALVETGAEVVNALVDFFIELIGALDRLFPVLSEALFKWLGTLIEDLLDFLDGVVPKLVKFVEDTFYLLGETLHRVIEWLLGEVVSYFQLLDKTVGDILAIIDHLVNETLIPGLTDLVVHTIETVANSIVEILVSGVGAVATALRNLVVGLWDAFKNAFKKRRDEDVDDLGESTVTSLGDAITKFKDKIKTAAHNIWNKLKQTFEGDADIDSPSKEMMKDGKYVVEGLAKGMENSEGTLEKSVDNLADTALGLSDAFVINADEFDMGKGFGSAFTNLMSSMSLSSAKNAVKDKLKEVFKNGFTEAGSDLASSSVSFTFGSKIKEMIAGVVDSGNFDTDLTITPVLDLSEIQNGSSKITDMLNSAIGGSSVGLNISDIGGSLGSTDNLGTVLNFTQNNYSPKELSRIDIYRQTNNQLSLAKGVL